MSFPICLNKYLPLFAVQCEHLWSIFDIFQCFFFPASQNWTYQNVVWNLFKVNNKKNQNHINNVVRVSLLLTLNKFHTFFWCCHGQLWTSKCWVGSDWRYNENRKFLCLGFVVRRDGWGWRKASTAQKMKFSIKNFFSKCVTRSAVFCEFGHIYWRNL